MTQEELYLLIVLPLNPWVHFKRRSNEKSTTQSDVRVLKATGLLDSNFNDGTFSESMHRFGERDIGRHIDDSSLDFMTEEGT
jgi:hypothetical protein